MTVDDPYADTPLPFLPTAWQKNADNPSYELNMLLVSQMGLFVSCLSVFEWGNEIEPGVHALAVVVLLAILTGDWCFFVFLRRAMARLRAAGSLEWVHDDAVYDLDKEGHRVWYQHDEDGHVLRDRWRRKKRAWRRPIDEKTLIFACSRRTPSASGGARTEQLPTHTLSDVHAPGAAAST